MRGYSLISENLESLLEKYLECSEKYHCSEESRVSLSVMDRTLLLFLARINVGV